MTIPYTEEAKYVASLTLADVAVLSRHRNRQIRERVTLTLEPMARRHANGDYNAVKDAQDCDTILYYVRATEIRSALVGLAASK